MVPRDGTKRNNSPLDRRGITNGGKSGESVGVTFQLTLNSFPYLANLNPPSTSSLKSKGESETCVCQSITPLPLDLREGFGSVKEKRFKILFQICFQPVEKLILPDNRILGSQHPVRFVLKKEKSARDVMQLCSCESFHTLCIWYPEIVCS